MNFNKIQSKIIKKNEKVPIVRFSQLVMSVFWRLHSHRPSVVCSSAKVIDNFVMTILRHNDVQVLSHTLAKNTNNGVQI